MPRYFFDVGDERSTDHDAEGTICADEQAVSTTAKRILTDIAADEPLQAGQTKLFATVRDEAGRVVYTAALNITGSWLQVPMITPSAQLEPEIA
ncbi:DUF6894 family protein [Methylobacterium oxalidis]|uniref:DUF6894 domain-containing protein n=1 Tax=Methylobacterium oxalidis TaxID=944322 RepID=A0A512JA79_9HYPH|nr:hypothetical protein [Methylobacterium oxalidis]GEP06799.1 hypothetical protein MOX02_48370 [Methylobacterium oxalidis]GJE34451.1 hypothetical protein LDDCCGHA_4662 [Methylobacterium oxalidis]GLS67103.1 hypothetical protein GCM10007888_54860 [Methylobacterium oxalidis]